MSALGQTNSYLIADLLGSGFFQFHTDRCHGLARIEGETLELLAVASFENGRGHFRDFIAACQREYARIEVLEIWEPVVKDALTRYGFKPFGKTTKDGEPVTGMSWQRP